MPLSAEWGRTAEDAARIAYRELLRWMAAECDFTEIGIYMLLTQAGRVRLGNIVDPIYAGRIDFEIPADLTRKGCAREREHLHPAGEKMKYRTVADATVGKCPDDARLVDHLLAISLHCA
jgi:hypothetical protein